MNLYKDGNSNSRLELDQYIIVNLSVKFIEMCKLYKR